MMYLRRRRAAGFSLIEMLVVLAIISILFSIGFSALQRYQKHKEVQQAQQTLISTLNQARSDARRASKDQTVSWSGDTVKVKEDGGDERSLKLNDAGTVTITGVTGISDSKVTYQAPNARADQTSFIFTLEGRGGVSARVRVTGVTGKAFSE